MDADRFDRIARLLSDGATRRGIARTLSALSLTGMVGSLLGLADAEAKKKKRKKKKKKCKGGKKKCGKKCIAATGCCTATDCDAGDICVQNQCVTGQGSCAAGADSCDSGHILCGGDTCACYATMEGQTRCGAFEGLSEECGDCVNDGDCAELFPAVPGVFCARSTTVELCLCPGNGFCAAPCPA